MENVKTFIRVSNGRMVDLAAPTFADLAPGNIGRSLSQLCRFTGHTRTHYSVAQHCVIVSKNVPREHALAGLLHDASEAFIGDISSPLKALIERRAPGVISEIEDAFHRKIAERYGFEFPFHESVHEADQRVGATEVRDVLASPSPDVYGHVEPLPFVIVPWTADWARLMWFKRLGVLLDQNVYL